MVERIPEIDMAPVFTSAAGKRAVAARIGAACREIGFFTIVNHGVSGDLIAAVFAQSRRFHGLPLEQKLEIDMQKSEFHRGYHPIAAQSVSPGTTPDLKEAFDMGLELPLTDPDVAARKPFHGPNTWPANLPGFHEKIMEYYDALIDLSDLLCSCFALDLGLPEGYFRPMHTKPLAQMRLLHYPPQERAFLDQQIGAGAHTDYGSVAVLAQDEVGGLEVMNTDGRWIPIEPKPGSFICNLGDIMEIWTNGLYPATRHRVINKGGRERFSQVLFYDPNYDCLVSPLPQLCSAERPARYRPITMGEHLGNMINSTYKYRKAN